MTIHFRRKSDLCEYLGHFHWLTGAEGLGQFPDL